MRRIRSLSKYSAGATVVTWKTRISSTSGVGRDCYLYARNKKRIQDIRVTPDLDAAYQNGSLAINLDLKGSGKVDLELVDAQGKQVATATANKSGLVTMNVENPKKWSAKTPYLYTLRASMQGSNEVIPVKK